MSKRPSLSNIENEGCSSKKQQRTSDTIHLSPACKEKMSTFKASAETVLQNIKLQTELAAIKNDYEILKNDYAKLEKLSEDYISKVDEENERLKEEHSIHISESAETLTGLNDKIIKLKSEREAEKIVCKEAKNRADELQKIVPQLKTTIRAKDVEILDLQQQLEEETENLEESQNELVQANLKFETLERELQDVKDESDNLRKRFDQVTGERDKQSKKNQEILDALNKKENELATSQNSNKLKDVEILDLRAQLEEETENLEKAQNELVQANLKIETIERELQDVKKHQKDDSAKFQKRIDEAAKELCNKEKENERKIQDVKDESENLRKRIDQVTAERDKQSKHNQEILVVLNKKENELANSIKLKDHEIADLNGQLNMQKEVYIKELQKVQTKLESSEAEAAKLQTGNSNLKNRCGALEQQIESLQTATAREKASWAKMDKEKEAKLLKMELVNEELKKSLEDSKKDVEDRAKEMFEEWKKKKGDKENTGEDQPKPEKTNKRKKSNPSSSKCNTSWAKDPTWSRVSKKKCEEMFSNSQDTGKPATSFLDQYAVELFDDVEYLQPFDELSKKMDEIKSVINYFYCSTNDETKELHYNNLKARLNTKRQRSREEEFINCNATRCVGYASNGDRFYYSVKSGDTWNPNGIWKPYTDKECYQKSMAFKKFPSSSFTLPWDYEKCEYILILQRSDTQTKIDKMFPANGHIKCITKRKTKSKR